MGSKFKKALELGHESTCTYIERAQNFTPCKSEFGTPVLTIHMIGVYLLYL